ncbi:MAG TPA: phage tail protein, partial [bacterium]|nr:phage tail protein [bacterium]
YGNDNSSNSDCRWHVPMLMALCEGPVSTISKIWNGGAAKAIPGTGINYGSTPLALGANFYDPAIAQPPIFTYLFQGNGAQNAWGYFAAADATPGGPYFTDQDLAYRSTAYVASTMVDGGNDSRGPGTPPQQSYEVVRTPSAPATDGGDYLPSEIITDVLTNTVYGLAMSSSDIDSTTHLNYQNYCGANDFYFSPLLASPSATTDFINRLALESNTWIFWAAAFFFVPLGDESLSGRGFTYTPDPSSAYTITNDSLVQGGKINIQRVDAIDVPNRIRADFTDRHNDYAKNTLEWKESTLINQFKIRDGSSVNFEDICDPTICGIALDLLAKRLVYIRNLFTFTLHARYILVLPGTVLTLTDPDVGLNAVAVRVTKVEENEKGDLAITAEEFPGTLGIARPPAQQAWTQSAGPTGGASSGGLGGGIGPPIGPGSGSIPAGIQFVEWAAGDARSLPATPTSFLPIYLKNISGDPLTAGLTLTSGSANIEPWSDKLGTLTATTVIKSNPGDCSIIVFDGTVWRWIE